MFIIVLLCSFFIHVNASEVVVSAEDFLASFARRFRGEVFEYRQSSSPVPTDNLITIHIRSFTRGKYDLPTLVRLITSGSAELVSTIKVHDPHHALMHNDKFSLELYEPGRTVSFGDIEMQRAGGSTRTVGMYKRKNCESSGGFALKNGQKHHGTKLQYTKYMRHFSRLILMIHQYLYQKHCL